MLVVVLLLVPLVRLEMHLLLLQLMLVGVMMLRHLHSALLALT